MYRTAYNVSIFLLIGAFAYALALECYNCDNSKNPTDKSCEEFKNLQKVPCGNSLPNQKAACLKNITKDKQGGVIYASRKCVILEDGKTSNECKKELSNLERVFCETCTEELCNGSAMPSINVFTFLAAIASILMAKIVLH